MYTRWMRIPDDRESLVRRRHSFHDTLAAEHDSQGNRDNHEHHVGLESELSDKLLPAQDISNKLESAIRLQIAAFYSLKWHFTTTTVSCSSIISK